MMYSKRRIFHSLSNRSAGTLIHSRTLIQRTVGSASLSLLLVLGLGLSLALSGCIRPKEAIVNADTEIAPPEKGRIPQPPASFYHRPVSGSTTLHSNIPGFSIPNGKIFRFSSCIHDRRTRESLIGHEFIIRGGAKEFRERTNDDGCLYWNELITYNAVVRQAKFVPLRRQIVGTGIHTGLRNLYIGINPWSKASSGSDVVVDLDINPVPDQQLAADSEAESVLFNKTKSGEIQTGRLWMDDLRTNITQDPNGPSGRLEFQYNLSSEILQKNVVGQQENIMLVDGQFKIEFWLIGYPDSASDKKQCAIISKTKAKPVRMQAQRLRDQVSMDMSVQLSWGTYHLVAKVEALDSAVALAPFSGAWMIGDHSSLLNMKFNQPLRRMYENADDEKSFDAAELVNGCKNWAPEKSELGLLAGPGVNESLPNLSQSIRSDGSYVGAFGTLKPVSDYKTNLPAQLPASEIAFLKNQKCARPEHIPYFFPYDSEARTLKASSDLLTCENKDLPSGVYRFEKFNFGVVRIGDGITAEPIKTGSETNSERFLSFLVNVPVINPATGTPVRDVEFQVTTHRPVRKKDAKTGKLTEVTYESWTRPERTNLLGRLLFNDEVFHDYYKEERFILKIIEIKHIASGFSRKLLVVINPWDNNGFTFGRDIRAISPDILVNINVEKRDRSQLLITGFNWNTSGFDYVVDDLLNLKIYKTFLITLVPRVLRYSSLVSGRAANEPLRDGLYVMRYALQKDYKAAKDIGREYISGNEKLVRVTEGRIVTPITFDFSDFRVLKLRSRLLIELEMIEEKELTADEIAKQYTKKPLASIIKKDSGLEPRTFIGPVVAYNNGFSAPLRPTDDLSEQYCGGLVDCGTMKTEASEVLLTALRNRETMINNWCTGTVGLGYGKDQPGFDNPKIPVIREIVDSSDFKKNGKCETEDRFFDSVTHLAGKSAKDVLANMATVNAKFRTEVVQRSKLARYFEFSNTELVSLADGPGTVLEEFKRERIQQRFLDPNPEAFQRLVLDGLEEWKTYESTRLDPRQVWSGNRTLEERLVAANSHLAAVMSFPRGKKRPSDLLQEKWFSQGYENGLNQFKNEIFGSNQRASIATMTLMCPVLIKKIIVPSNEKYYNSKMARSLLESCRKAVGQALNVQLIREKDQKEGNLRRPDPYFVDRSPISIERFFRTKKVGGSTRARGNLLILGVNAGTSLGTSKGASFSYGFSPLATLESFIKVGAAIAGGALAGVVAAPVVGTAGGVAVAGAAATAVSGTGVAGAISGAMGSVAKIFTANQGFVDKTGLSLNLSQSISDSQGRDTGTSAGTSLAVELRTMNTQVDEYERCAHFRLRKSFIEYHMADLIAKNRTDFFDIPEFDRLFVRGLTVCEGVVQTKPVVISERYYMFSQSLGDEVINDPTAIENQPYMIAVRGRSDYKRFVNILQAEVKDTRMLPRVDSIAEVALDRIDHAIEMGGTPTFGGILRIEEDTFGPVQVRRLPENRKPWGDPLMDWLDQNLMAPVDDPNGSPGMIARFRSWITSIGLN